MAVTHTVALRPTVLSMADAETARDLQADLPKNNPRCVALLQEDTDIMTELKAKWTELTDVTKALSAASPFNVSEAGKVGSPHTCLRQFFSTSLHDRYREQLTKDVADTRGRPNSVPWATLNLYFSDATTLPLRLLEQAQQFGPRCLSVLHAAVQDLRAPPAVPAQRETTSGSEEDWTVQAARAGELAEAAEEEAAARYAADAEALLDDDLDNVMTGFKKQRERKRAKGKGEAK